MDIKKRYIVDENDKRVAVQLDMEAFEKIEQILEDYALVKAIPENNDKENVTLQEAKQQQQQLTWRHDL
jgi:hypothetical protein